jgi:hypothetical protein
MSLFLGRFVFACFSVCTIVAMTSAGEESSVKGVYKGNGKETKLSHVLVKKGDKDRKDRIIILFTEKEMPKGKDPEFDAIFGRLGSALVITIKPDGQITGCHIAHSALGKGGFQSIGEITMSDFKLADGTVSGKLSSGGEQKAFGETWEVDLTFKAKAP